MMRLSSEFELPLGTPKRKAERAAEEMIGTLVRDSSKGVIGTVKEAVAVAVGNRWQVAFEADVEYYRGAKR